MFIRSISRIWCAVFLATTIVASLSMVVGHARSGDDRTSRTSKTSKPSTAFGSASSSTKAGPKGGTPKTTAIIQSASPLYLHGAGSSDNPPTIFLNNTAPTGSTAKFKDSSSINFNGGNPWKEIGSWAAQSTLTGGTLTALSDLHVWLGLKNSDDQGTNFDVRAEVYKNGVLVSSGVTLCVTGVTRNANNAKEVTVSFAPFSATPFNGTTDVLSVKILTRIGTNVSGSSCGGHNNAVGLRLYFDASNRASKFDATIVQGTPPPTITATVTPAPNAAGWNNSNPTVTFTCVDTGGGIASCSGPVTVSTETSGEDVVGTATDSTGNTATISVTIKLDKTPPVIASTVTPEPNAAQWNNSNPTVTFSCSDETSGTDSCTAPVTITTETAGQVVVGNTTDKAGNAATASVTVKLDKTPPSITGAVTPTPNAEGWNHSDPTVTFTCSDSTSGNASCTPPVSITTETAEQSVVGTATDRAGNSATASLTVKLDKTPPSLTVASPADGSRIFSSPVAVGGTGTDELSGLKNIICNGASATMGGANFNCSVVVTPGANSIAATAADIAGNTSTSNLSLTLSAAPAITITSPTRLSYLNISPTTVSGTVDDPTATVSVNSVQAAVVNGTFSVALPLAEGPNIIVATATSANGSVGSATIEVTLDTTPPHVTITSPPDRFVTTDTSVSIAGNVNDIVVGTVNDLQAQVTVEGQTAQVANRSFMATNVPLAIGPNMIQAVARDRVGNAATTQIMVTRQAATQPQIRLVSGNNQTGSIGSILLSPLVVLLTDAENNPVPNQSVIFKVKQDDGKVSTGSAPAASVIATTNALGQAQVQWTLGMRSGAGANEVHAVATGFVGTVIFSATGTQGPPGKIVIDTGNNQIGEINQPLPKPLIAVVVDTGNNRLSGVPVTFTVTEGGGSFDGQPSFTVNTDSDGRAAATLTTGFQEGSANNRVEASFPSNQSFPASFTASGRVPGDPARTTISGVVLDNSNIPIPGVTIRAVLTNVLNSNSTSVQSAAAVQTDAQGQFTIPQAPIGFVKLLVDGSTAQREGTYPTLDYDMVTVAGRTNTVGMPIYLLPLNPANQLCVTATSGGGTLTMPEAPGFALTFGPGQVTFPGGSKTGCVSVTVVHGDKVPMVPGFGQQPRFIVTIQPAGAVFNAPARITLPNVDGLAPRAVTEMYSFDHDIGSFVAIGTGTVSDDGQTITSNPGVGVLKAGWHCGGDPNSTGSTASLSLSVTPDKVVVAVGEQFDLTASGAPPKDGVYEWTPGSNVSGVSTPSCAGLGTCLGKFKGTTAGTVNTKVCFRCTTTGAVKCQDVSVTVVKVELKKLTFKTDHGLMRDNNSNYTASGSVFTKPDWTDAGKNNPISHTMNQNVGVELEFLVTPSDAPSRSYTIKGTGPTGLNYESTINLPGGTVTIPLTSTDKLENKVQKLTGSINWVITKDSTNVLTVSTGSHTVYVTMGTPRNDGTVPNSVTQKRMERAVQVVAAAGSLDPHTIVKRVIQDQGAFDLSGAKVNEWEVPDSPSDCQSIVRFTAAVLNMINVPGTVVHKNVYAIESAPTRGIEVDPPGGLNNPRRFHPNGIWLLALIDGSAGCNAFEATAKFTHGGVTKYYAGGTQGIFDNPNQVLTVFQSLSWIDFVRVGTVDRCVVQQVIHRY